MRYCGICMGTDVHYLCALYEVRDPEPPIRLEATFYEPGTTEQLLAELTGAEEAVVAIAAPTTRPGAAGELRLCDTRLRECGVPVQPFREDALRLLQGLARQGLFVPDTSRRADERGEDVEEDGAPPAGLGNGNGRGEADAIDDEQHERPEDDAEGEVPEGAFRSARIFETNADGIFFSLQGRRMPAKRHPLGIERRIDELLEDHVQDPDGDLWHRRIEELEAAAAALCAHRYAVGHALWVGDPEEGVVVLPGSGPLEPFSTEGVIPPVPRAPLPRA